MTPLERKHLFEKTLSALGECVVLVEGKKDEMALREAGFAGVVVQAVGQVERIVSETARVAGKRQVALLFDYDDEGKRKMAFFKERFALEGVRADDLLWKKLRVALQLKHVEDLVSKLRELDVDVSEKRR